MASFHWKARMVWALVKDSVRDSFGCMFVMLAAGCFPGTPDHKMNDVQRYAEAWRDVEIEKLARKEMGRG